MPSLQGLQSLAPGDVFHVTCPSIGLWDAFEKETKIGKASKMFPIQGQIHVSNHLARNTIIVVETSICASFNPVMKITEWDFSVWDARVW